MAVLVPSRPYTVTFVVTNPGAVNNLGIQNGASKVLVVVRAKISLAQATIPSAANARIQLIRKTAAPTWTAAVTPARLEPGDPTATFTAGHTSTANGTDGDILDEDGWGSTTGWTYDWSPTPEEYALIVPGTGNGLALKSNVAPSAGNYSFSFKVHEIA